MSARLALAAYLSASRDRVDPTSEFSTRHHPVSAGSWARSSRSLGVDCTCCDRSFASSAAASDRRAA
jgi:hypothetical protein